MLSLMAAATQELTLTSHRTERRAWDRARADAALRAGITEAILGITAPALNDRWRVDGATREITLSDFRVDVTVQAESGRYDLNAVDASVLTTLLRSQGVDPDQATALANSILDWRSPAGPHRLNAAIDDDYAAHGLSYCPRHGPFQSVNELQLVLGITPDLFERIRPALTVYTKRAMIDPAVAPKQALLALYEGNEDRVNALLKAREESSDSGSSPPTNSRPGTIGFGASPAGQAFDIEAETSIEGRTYRRQVVFAFTGSDRVPLIRLAWQDR